MEPLSILITLVVALVVLGGLRMADLTADTTHETLPRAGRRAFVIEDAVELFAGSFVGINAGGYLEGWEDTAGWTFVGLLLEGDTGDTSATPPPAGKVDCSGPTLVAAAVASVADTDMGALVYCETDNPADMDLTASTNVKAVGWVSRFYSAGIADVTLFTPEEYLGLN